MPRSRPAASMSHRSSALSSSVPRYSRICSWWVLCFFRGLTKFLLARLEDFLSSVLKPGQCDCHSVFAEDSVVADRAIALVLQLSIRPGCESHAIALGTLDAGANLVSISVYQANRPIVEVGRAARQGSGVRQLLNGADNENVDKIRRHHVGAPISNNDGSRLIIRPVSVALRRFNLRNIRVPVCARTVLVSLSLGEVLIEQALRFLEPPLT
jgi:hypothetical protein